MDSKDNCVKVNKILPINDINSNEPYYDADENDYIIPKEINKENPEIKINIHQDINKN